MGSRLELLLEEEELLLLCAKSRGLRLLELWNEPMESRLLLLLLELELRLDEDDAPWTPGWLVIMAGRDKARPRG